MSIQMQLPEPERVIELSEYLECSYHGSYPWECYFEDREIIQMLDEQGWIDCPLCLAEIVGTE